METIFRVGSKTNAKSLAAALAHALHRQPDVELRAIGAAAVNQAIKAIIVARGLLAQRGADLYVVPDFTTADVPDAVVSLVVLKVHRRHPAPGLD